MGPVDAAPADLETVRRILREHAPGLEARAFGSRVSWTARETSDLDLALMTDEPLDAARMAALRSAFTDSRLPFRVDVVDWAGASDGFREAIESGCVTLVGKGERQGRGRWPRATLGDCIRMNDSTYSPKEAWPFVNYLDTGNVTENRVDGIHRLIPGKDEIPSRARRKARPGDILYSTVRPNQKHFGLLKEVPENFLASTGFSVFRGKADVAHTDFIYWFLAQDHVVERLHTIAEHSTSAYPSIRPSDIEELTLALPPLPEQRAIARVLGALDDKIGLNRRMNETLEAMAQAVFKSWFVDFAPVRAKTEGRDTGLPGHIADLFPDRLVDSELGEIPEGWEISEIGAEVDAVGGATPSTKEPAYWIGGKLHWATPKDLAKLRSPVLLETNSKITDAGIKKISTGLLPAGTVLLSSRAPIGYLAIAEVPTAINQGFIAMICRKRLPNIYVLFWCHENLDYIKAISVGSTFAEINKKSFRPIPVLVPPKGVLALYEDAVRPLYDRIVANVRESAPVAEARDILLPKLVSGEVRPGEAVERLESAA